MGGLWGWGIVSFDPISYAMGAQAAGGSSVLVPLEVTNNGRYTPGSYSANGFSDVRVEVPYNQKIYLAYSDTLQGLTELHGYLAERLVGLGTGTHGVVGASVNGSNAMAPVRLQLLGVETGPVLIMGGAVDDEGEGMVINLHITSSTVTCNALYSISGGVLTDLTAYAGAILSGISINFSSSVLVTQGGLLDG